VETQINLVAILGEEGKLAEAEALGRRVEAVRQKLPESENPLARMPLNSLAGVLFREGKFTEAETMQREIVEIRRKLFPNGHPDLASSLLNLGKTLRTIGKPGEAEPIFREAAEMSRKFPGRESGVRTALALNFLGMVLSSQEKWAESISVMKETMARWTELGSYPAQIAGCRYYIGLAYYHQGALPDAEKSFREVLAIRDKMPGKSSEAPDSHYYLGLTLKAEGKLPEAIEALTRAGEQGRPEAWSMLAQIYERGEGVPSDHSRAVFWYQKTEQARRKDAEKGTPAALNSLAWLLATCPAAEIRNGTNSLALAHQALDAGKKPAPDVLDTLAAAYAETGDFTNAIAAEKEAIPLQPDKPTEVLYANRLKLYESNEPFRTHE
jgi:tetratricopeptide (TPR) repeat protein